MKNKFFMFLIVFSLMLGVFGTVFAISMYPVGDAPSSKSVPAVLKITGNLDLNAGVTYNVVILQLA